jgi:hypothetical protein
MLFVFCTGEAMATEKPWVDWPDTDIGAGFWVKEKGYMRGYEDGLFRPNEDVYLYQFTTVLGRAGIITGLIGPAIPISIGDAQKYLPLAKVGSKPAARLTRYRLAVMLYRHFVTPVDVDKVTAQKIEELFQEHPHDWNGVTRVSRMVGHADTIVRCSKQYNVPISLCLAQGWAESCWFTGGKSLEYNMGFGMKDSKLRWGTPGVPTFVGSGFTNYISIDESIEAYFRLMSSPIMPYRALIDKWVATGDISYVNQALDIYAPPHENDPGLKNNIKIVIGWVNEKGIK